MTALATHFGAITPAAAGPRDHRGARGVLDQAWRFVVRRTATLPELQAVQAIALLETGYGHVGQFPGSHNWGAVQMPGTWGATDCPADGFLGGDTSPRSDGTNVRSSVCFRSYVDDVAGAIDLVRQLTNARPRTLAALSTGDVDRVAAAMYAEHYYEGHGATAAERVAGYGNGIAKRAALIARALGEPLVVQRRALETRSGLPLLPLASLLGFALLHHHVVAGEASDPTLVSGDLLPTFVSPEDAKRYVHEVDAGWERTEHDAQGSNLEDGVKHSWSIDLAGWRRFRDDALQHVGWLNTKATMEQTDRWGEKLATWRKSLADAGAKLAGPGPIAPAQGSPVRATASVGWMQLALVIAGLFGIGYVVRGFRGAL